MQNKIPSVSYVSSTRCLVKDWPIVNIGSKMDANARDAATIPPGKEESNPVSTEYSQLALSMSACVKAWKGTSILLVY